MLRRNIAASRNLETDPRIVNPILLQCSMMG